MAIDASIALGVKPVQLESPVNQMSNAYALQNAAQSNQLNQMKMEEYKKGLAEEDQFKNALHSSNDDVGIKNAFYSLGQKGVKAYADYQKSNVETGNLKLTGQETQGKISEQKMKQRQAILRDTSRNPSDANLTAHAEDIQLSPLYSNEEKAASQRMLTQLLAMPISERQTFLASQGASASDLKPHFTNQENVMVNGKPTTRVVQMPAFGGTAQTVAGSSATTYNKPAANVNVTTNLPAQEKEFEKELGTQQAKKVVADKVKAEDAAQILATNQVAKNLLDKGMITGTGADFFVGLNNALNKAGMDFGGADAASNSQAYGGLMATNTAKLIKNFGAGTGLSDADRIYSKQAAAGDINMDEKAIRKLIDINNRAAQNVIMMHNKNVSNIKTNIPLSVNPADYSAGIPEGRGTTSAKRGQQTLDDIFKTR